MQRDHHQHKEHQHVRAFHDYAQSAAKRIPKILRVASSAYIEGTCALLFRVVCQLARQIMPPYSSSGLEVDQRATDQSEKIANGGHSYLDHDGLVPAYRQPSAWQTVGESPISGLSNAMESEKQQRRRSGLGGPVLLLSIALAIAVILAVVAAGIGGSLAASRKSELDR